MFSVGDEFNSFAELSTKLKKFEKEQCTQLYVRSSRTIESTKKRAPKKVFNGILNSTMLAFMAGKTSNRLQQENVQIKCKSVICAIVLCITSLFTGPFKCNAHFT